MTELEIMKRAQMYIESLAKGIDPLSGQPVKDDDIINNVRISRCLFYVSDILKKNIENGGTAVKHTNVSGQKEYFSLTAEQIDALTPNEQRLSAARITSYINTFIDTDRMQKLTATSLVAWLMEAGFLCEMTDEHGKKRKVPTENGLMTGMEESVFRTETGINQKYVTYDENAQQFIFDNISSIAQACRCEAEEKALIKTLTEQNKGKPWSEEDDARLLKLYDSGATLKVLSAELRRTRGAIKARLAGHGRIEG